jgi:hypothetical protein
MVSSMGKKRAFLLVCAVAAASVLAMAGAVWAAVSSNPGPISIPTSGQATPYPAKVDVAGLSGPITDVNVTLHGVSHTFTDDVAVLLVGPGGQKVMLMSDAGGGQDLNGVDLTFDDEATRSLPDGTSQITTGSYKPTRGANSGNKVPASLPSPAPAGPYEGALSAFDGADPNGTYDLYVFDDAPGDGGQVAGGFSVDITAGASPATDRLPDLGMAHPMDLQIENTADGRKLLRFSSVVVNVGAGAFEVHGEQLDSDSDLETRQRVFDSAGGHRDVPTDAIMYFGGDGHNHWHVRDLEYFELTRLDNGNKVGTAAKHGFCFFDSYRYGATGPGSYNQPSNGGNACAGGASATQTVMGLSRGWGDIYQSSLPDQYVDITGLANGRYELRGTADPDHWFVESNNSNNFSWMNINIKGNVVNVVRYGPAAPRIQG